MPIRRIFNERSNSIWRQRRGSIAADFILEVEPSPPCGSEPARESGVSFNTSLTDPSYSRAGSLPQGVVVGL
ncbi:hypothetical protein DMX04_01310 [Pseudomonas koreensis]|nr:hypothetical protein DMX04_01310 [Pseudomonas koreensis]